CFRHSFAVKSRVYPGQARIASSEAQVLAVLALFNGIISSDANLWQGSMKWPKKRQRQLYLLELRRHCSAIGPKCLYISSAGPTGQKARLDMLIPFLSLYVERHLRQSFHRENNHMQEIEQNRQAVIHRLVAACQTDERVVAAFLGGAHYTDATVAYSVLAF